MALGQSEGEILTGDSKDSLACTESQPQRQRTRKFGRVPNDECSPETSELCLGTLDMEANMPFAPTQRDTRLA